MFTFDKINETNGFDTANKRNAIQNSYASAITELDSYIYVGTVRNALSSFEYSKDSCLTIPPWIQKGCDNNAEIWRYKKDGTKPWQRVFKANKCDNIRGFSSLITHTFCDTKTIYAAAISTKVIVLMSTDGEHWSKVDTACILGTSAKCLYSFNDKVYLSTIKIGFNKNSPFLYASKNPADISFYPVIDTDDIHFNPSKNPVGRIETINSFNDNLYLGVSTSKGCQLWRSIDSCPKTNKWIQVGMDGFFDRANTNIVSTGVYKNHLYVSCSKILPLALLAPLGFDLVRVDKCDNVENIVGGSPLIPSSCETQRSLSGYNSGFNSYFNVYGLQIQTYMETLFITTYDASTNMTLIRDSIIYNSECYIDTIGYSNYNDLLKSYTDICNLLTCYKYPKGFDIYESSDGINFNPLVLNGLNDINNYGGKSLYKGSNGLLYLGTSNPYEGCEMWEINKDNYITDYADDDMNCYYQDIEKINKALKKIYTRLIQILNLYPCV